MCKIRISILIILLGGTWCSAKVAAQNDSISRPDFEYIKSSEAWFTSNNAAGLYVLPVNDVSIAEAYFNKIDGKFINYFQSKDSYQYGGRTESYYRLSPKVVLYGYVEYSDFEGKDMGGSAFINPYNVPFDIVEYSDSTRGKKGLEQYHLTGAVSAEVYKGLRLGGKIDYLAAKYAKFRDLRHENKLMDMAVTAGVSYEVTPMIEVGANYFYRRSMEGMKFKTFGNTDRLHYSLISFGGFYGHRELHGEAGYMNGDRYVPVFNEFHGGSFQLNLNLSPRASLFNEFTYKARDGYYGIKSSNDIQYTQHNSTILAYNGVFSLKTNRSHHALRVTADRELLKNNENIYKTVSAPNGSSVVEYYGKNKVLHRENINAKVEYVGNIDINNYYPTWVLKAVAEFASREQTTSFYPYFRKQEIRSLEANIQGCRNIFSGKNIYSISLGAMYAKGSGTAKDDGLYATPPINQKVPGSIDKYLYEEYEYLTASRMGVDLGFKYSRPVSDEVRGYLGLDCSLTKAMSIEYLRGSTFASVAIKIGCSF